VTALTTYQDYLIASLLKVARILAITGRQMSPVCELIGIIPRHAGPTKMVDHGGQADRTIGTTRRYVAACIPGARASFPWFVY